EKIFQKAIEENCRGEVMDTLTEIQERHEAARDVEKKLLELQKVFFFSPLELKLFNKQTMVQ
ncbi:hypothetical protein MKX03_002658, partial [Papaver bracteatum]